MIMVRVDRTVRESLGMGSYLNTNDREKLKPTYLQNDEEFLEAWLFEKLTASEYFYDELSLDLYNLYNILYRLYNI